MKNDACFLARSILRQMIEITSNTETVSWQFTPVVLNF